MFRSDKSLPVPLDAMTALVSAIELGEYVLDEELQIPAEVWTDVTFQTTIETGLLIWKGTNGTSNKLKSKEVQTQAQSCRNC